ncbi:MAG: hypothetical protein QOF23_1455, partial [Solirubrobacterales bacterium]|nr:hypothetical protein [Solirubrobacterales bacterium]
QLSETDQLALRDLLERAADARD